MLAKQSDIEVVGEADDGRGALEVVGDCTPDVVVMDIGMRDMNGIDATRELTTRCPDIRVVALSMHSDQRYVSEMLSAGASGYLLKDSAFDELAAAIKAVAAGQRYLSPSVAGVVLDDYVRRLSDSGEESPVKAGRGLSRRETEVLALIGDGQSTKEIAATLHLSVKTVETHRRQIMDKLGIYNVAGLIKYAVREGLASLDE
jgi:two-component system, NarL family, response regulator NreC